MTPGDAKTARENLVETAFRETMDEGAVGAVDSYFADDLDYYRSSGELAGKADLAEDIEMFRTAFPDLDATVDRVLSDGPKVSFLYHLTGVHEGEFEGIPPTRQSMDAKGAAIARVEDETIVEYRIVFDNLGMLEQLGVLGE